MNKIYKYRLPRDGGVVTIDDYVIDWLRVANQDGVPTAWGVTDVSQSKGKRTWEIVAWGTGWDLPDEIWLDCEYIGTCEDGYGYVWHYFARRTDSPSLANDSTSASVHVDGTSGAISSTSIYWDEGVLNKLLSSTTQSTIQAVNDYIMKANYAEAADHVCATDSICFVRQ